MEFVEVKFDLERSRQIFKRYLDHERKRAFKKAPSFIVLGVCLALIGSGLFFNIIFMTYIGVLLAIALAIFLLFLYMKFHKAFKNFCAKLNSVENKAAQNFKLGFDSKEILHQYGTKGRRLSWDKIEHYEIDQQDIFLFLEDRKLYDIMSESIMGKPMFERFKAMLIEKTRKTDSTESPSDSL
jgi:hypothetical protein